MSKDCVFFFTNNSTNEMIKNSLCGMISFSASGYCSPTPDISAIFYTSDRLLTAAMLDPPRHTRSQSCLMQNTFASGYISPKTCRTAKHIHLQQGQNFHSFFFYWELSKINILQSIRSILMFVFGMHNMLLVQETRM